MKKIFSLLLVVSMFLSLCACGGGDKLDKSDASNYVGVWESATLRLTITKGGIGNWGFLSVNDSSSPIKWEIKEDIMVVTKSVAGFEYNAAFELNDSGNTIPNIFTSTQFTSCESPMKPPL